MPATPRTSAHRPGRYVLTEQIGAGGMGSVWLAWDRRARRWVAAKLLSRSDAAATQRFVREQRLRVRHRHVLQPADRVVLVEPTGERTLFTMDLVRGGSLQDLLARHGPLPVDYVVVLLEQVLEALVAVHAAGLVHRDVKPGNLLLEVTGTGRPHVRLGDFGVAAVTGEGRTSRAAGGVGTGGYMAPEQAAGSAADPRQDLYAVGVLGRHLLTGSPTQAPPPPRGPLGDLLEALASAEATARPASASTALARLRRAVGVPAGAPWQHRPRPPDVPDRYGDPVPPTRTTERWLPGSVPALVVTCSAGFAAAGVAGGLGTWVLLR